MVALIICRNDFSVIALIGIVLLIGIVKKNAIMMIDFALAAERKEGMKPEEAIYQACLLRFRPIMMTTMAALLGAVPLAFGSGSGSELRRPLGITIIGGIAHQPTVDALHDASYLHLVRSVVGSALTAARGCQDPGCRLSGFGRVIDEYLGTIYPEACRDHAPVGCNHTRWCRGIPATPCVASPASGVSHDLR